MARRCTLPPTGNAAAAAAFHAAVVPSLTTARLTLRGPRMADLPGWTAVWMESFAEDGDTEERAWDQFCGYTAGWMLQGHGLWSVERLEDGALVGFVLLSLEWDDVEPELGYMMLAEHRGRGYASEAAEAARNYGFTLLDSFVSYVDPDNAASNALARRIGGRRDAAAEAALEGEAIHVWRHRPETGEVVR